MTDPLDLLDGAVAIRKPRLTALDIKQMRMAGLKTKEIARRINRSSSYIRGLMSREGISLRRSVMEKQELLAQFARGVPIPTLARKYGISPGGIKSLAFRNGVHRPRVDGAQRRNHLPVAEERKIEALRYLPIDDIAVATGHDIRAIRRCIKRLAGVDKPTLAVASRQVKYARICTMYRKGVPNKTIRWKVGCGSFTIYNALRGTSIAPRRSPIYLDPDEDEARPYKVYRLAFPNGFSYVGVTVVKLQARIINHRYNCVRGDNPNEEFCRQLAEGQFTVTVLSRHADAQAAGEAERVAIRAESKTYNSLWADPTIQEVRAAPRMPRGNGRKRKRGPYPRQDGRDYRCRYCGETKPAGHFHTDTRRSCGIASKCASCANELRTRIRRGNRHGVSSDVIYAEFKAEKQRGWDD